MVILIIGGSASGKSEFAERICTLTGGQVAYIATMQPFGKDAQYRIARHLKLRERKGFLTVEQYTDIAKLRNALRNRAQTLLIECMSNLCANEMFAPEGVGPSTSPVRRMLIFPMADAPLASLAFLSSIASCFIFFANTST